MPLTSTHNYSLVALSVFVGISAAYAALDLAGRVNSARGWLRPAWLAGGAIAMGVGMWSMHFTGMKAFSLPVPVGYDLPTVLLSLLVGILASAFSLFVVSWETMGSIRIVAASIIMGAAIAAVHYIGMAAMRMAAECEYNPRLVTLSVALAILTSFVGLWLGFHFQDEAAGTGWQKIAGAVAIAAVTLTVQGLAVLTSYVDRRFAAQKVELLSSQILHLQDEERRRIARDLHDDLGQTLFVASLNLGQIPKFVPDERARKLLSETQEMIGSCVDKLRTLAHLLHPPELEPLGLKAAIVVFVDGFRERSGIQVEIDIPAELPRLPVAVERALFKVTQESLLNIQRHSGSSKAQIRLEADSDQITLEVRDEGVGMQSAISETAQGSGPRLGVGVAGMSERLKQLGGRLEIATGNWGTSVKAILLLAARELRSSVGSE